MALSTIIDRVRQAFGAGNGPGQLDALLTPERMDFLRAAADLGTERLRRYKLYEDYYDSQQRTLLLDRAKQFLQQHQDVRWCENFCETVVDTHATRLEVTGFQVEDDDDDNGISDWLTHQILGRPGMDEQQGIVHTNTYMKGDGFLILVPDERRVEACWNRPDIIKPVYDDDGDELLYVVKKWSTTRRTPTNPKGELVWRLNLYFPERIEKWFSLDEHGEHWAPHLDPDDYEDRAQVGEDGAPLTTIDEQTGEQVPVMAPAPVWPIPWTMDGTPDGEPIGINVIHFRRKPKGRRMGRSILHGAIPQQDGLNKAILDLWYVSDFQAWAQRYITGVSDTDAIKVAIGEYLTITNADAKVGQIDPSDPAGPLAVIADQLARMSARSHTPLHDLIIKGTPPSGEALKTAESGLVHDLEDDQKTFGTAWGQFARMNWRIATAFGYPDVPAWPDGAEIEVIWDSVETRDELAEAQTLLVHEELGVSKRTIVRKLGYDPDEEERLRGEEQAADPLLGRLAPPPPGGDPNHPPDPNAAPPGPGPSGA